MTVLLDVRSLGPDDARERILEALAEAERGEGATAEVLCIARSADVPDDVPLAPRPPSDASGRLRRRVLAAAESEVLLAVRRPAGEPELSIEVHMKREHGRAFALLTAGAEAVERSDATAARVYFSLLVRLLRKHIEVEEDLLLPVLSTRYTQPRGPAAVLRDEHVVVLDLLESLAAVINDGPELSPALPIVRTLERKLRSHMATEEELIYRLSDARLDDEERASLIDFCRTMD